VIIIDTGPVVAAANRKDAYHKVVEQYSDLPLGTADAIVIAIAERFRAVNIATLDRRHFSVVRPAHTTSFTLLP
jgi:uncharacterized protein